jgi:hypothetical protein
MNEEKRKWSTSKYESSICWDCAFASPVMCKFMALYGEGTVKEYLPIPEYGNMKIMTKVIAASKEKSYLIGKVTQCDRFKEGKLSDGRKILGIS